MDINVINGINYVLLSIKLMYIIFMPSIFLLLKNIRIYNIIKIII